MQREEPGAVSAGGGSQKLFGGVVVTLEGPGKVVQVVSCWPEVGFEEALNIFNEALDDVGMLVQEEGECLTRVHQRPVSKVVAGKLFAKRTGAGMSAWPWRSQLQLETAEQGAVWRRGDPRAESALQKVEQVGKQQKDGARECISEAKMAGEVARRESRGEEHCSRQKKIRSSLSGFANFLRPEFGCNSKIDCHEFLIFLVVVVCWLKLLFGCRFTNRGPARAVSLRWV